MNGSSKLRLCTVRYFQPTTAQSQNPTVCKTFYVSDSFENIHANYDADLKYAQSA